MWRTIIHRQLLFYEGLLESLTTDITGGNKVRLRADMNRFICLPAQVEITTIHPGHLTTRHGRNDHDLMSNDQDVWSRFQLGRELYWQQ